VNKHQDEPRGNPERDFLVRILQAGNRIFCRTFHRLTIQTPCPLPGDGPAIFVCNHVSGLDPMLVQSAVPHRLVIWMMAKEYYDVKALGWVYRTVHAIPVERSGRDLAATRSALRALEQGRILGIFPEGKIEPSRDLLPFQTGVALMAIKSEVDVYPAYLDGTQRGKEMVPAVLSPNRACLTFGPKVEFDRSSTSRASLEEATEKIRAAVEGLRQQQQSVYNDNVVWRGA
jgi:1-acyl-sn-glycerol-3-phosphate acyltransferase